MKNLLELFKYLFPRSQYISLQSLTIFELSHVLCKKLCCGVLNDDCISFIYPFHNFSHNLLITYQLFSSLAVYCGHFQSSQKLLPTKSPRVGQQPNCPWNQSFNKQRSNTSHEYLFPRQKCAYVTHVYQ